MSFLVDLYRLFWTLGIIVTIAGAAMVILYLIMSKAGVKLKVLGIVSIAVLVGGAASLFVSLLYLLAYELLLTFIP